MRPPHYVRRGGHRRPDRTHRYEDVRHVLLAPSLELVLPDQIHHLRRPLPQALAGLELGLLVPDVVVDGRFAALGPLQESPRRGEVAPYPHDVDGHLGLVDLARLDVPDLVLPDQVAEADVARAVVDAAAPAEEDVVDARRFARDVGHGVASCSTTTACSSAAGICSSSSGSGSGWSWSGRSGRCNRGRARGRSGSGGGCKHLALLLLRRSRRWLHGRLSSSRRNRRPGGRAFVVRHHVSATLFR